MKRRLKVAVSDAQLEKLVADCLENFFRRKLEILRTFRLTELLLNLNPYLLKIDSNENASKIVEELMKAQISDSDEAIFEDVFSEPVARIASSGKTALDKPVRFMRNAPTKHAKQYALAWDAGINRFTAEFIKDFCFTDGSIDWEKLVQFVSKEKPKSQK